MPSFSTASYFYSSPSGITFIVPSSPSGGESGPGQEMMEAGTSAAAQKGVIGSWGLCIFIRSISLIRLFY